MLEQWIGRKQLLGLMFLRLALAVIFIAHGCQKMLGWFGGGGIEQTIEAFTQMGVFWPTATVWITACVELLGGILLLIGFLTRETATLLIAIMIGAIATVHYPNGFFNVNGGYEYNLLIIAACLCLFFSGGGGASLDRIIFPHQRWTFIKDPASIKLDPPSDYDF